MTREIENELKKYRLKKCSLNTMKKHLELWEEILLQPEILDHMIQSIETKKELFITYVDIQIKAILDKDRGYDLEQVKSIISREKLRISVKETEILILEKELQLLPKKESFAIECRYFKDMSWKEIEIKYNEKFDTKYIKHDALRKASKKGLKTLKERLKL